MYSLCNHNFLLSIAQCYINSIEGNNRYLLGENPIHVVYKFDDTIFYDKGFRKVAMDIYVEEGKPTWETAAVSNIFLYVDLKVFQNNTLFNIFASTSMGNEVEFASPFDDSFGYGNFFSSPEGEGVISTSYINVIVVSNDACLDAVTIPDSVDRVKFEMENTESKTLHITNKGCLIEVKV